MLLRRFHEILALPLLLLVAPGLVPLAAEARRVYFVDGRSLDVVAIEVQGSRATLTLPNGGTLGIPATRVLRVEALGEVKLREAGEPVSGGQPSGPGPRRGSGPSATDPPEPGRARETSVESIEDLIESAAARYGLDVELLAAVIAVESGFEPGAVSPKGAQGLMQLMPATARELNVTDPFDPRQNIDAGARYLRQLLDQHDGSFVRSLAAYNAGMGRVARYNGIPPYRETIRYIRRVLDEYEATARRP